MRWDLVRSRDLMRRRGVESVADDAPFTAPLAPHRRRRRQRPSKAEQREQLETAVAQYTGPITRLPPASRNRSTRE
jgi:hypothetical protein